MRFSCALVIGFLTLSNIVSAEIPQVVTYQGKVTDNSGTSVPDDYYTMRFRLYDIDVGGAPAWDSGDTLIATSGGVFSVILGADTQPPISLPFDQDYWLEVVIDGDVQSPRTPFGSVGYAYMASGLVPGTEMVGDLDGPILNAINISETGLALRGETTATEGAAIVGHASSTDGWAIGIVGESDAEYGTGVFGWAKAVPDSTIGVFGRSDASSGQGVYGWASATTGTNYGGYFKSSSEIGTGVAGEASASTGFAVGVRGKTASSAGNAVLGEATATEGTTFAGRFLVSSTSGTAVRGLASATTGTTFGASFQSSSSGGTGIVGSATASTGLTVGVHGVTNSPIGYGIYGEATDGSLTAKGVYAKTMGSFGTGVYSEALATTGTCIGVYGRSASNSGIGIWGEATATTGTNYGIYGESASSDGYGVYGEATATTGSTYGLYGRSDSSDGIGVYGEATASTTNGNWGVVGVASSTGVVGAAIETAGYSYGGYFSSSSPSGAAVHGIATYSSIGSSDGGWFQSSSNSGTGVHGVAAHATGFTYGVYGLALSSHGYGVYYSGGLAGTGSKSCVVKTSRGPTLLYCQESTECWFEDFGEGQLVHGRAHIELDPLFLETVTVDAANPIQVFVQPYHSSCAVLVVERGRTGFDVHNPLDDSASGAFGYRVVAKRKGFEQKRLDYCKAAETDPYLYREVREKLLRETEVKRTGIEELHRRGEEGRVRIEPSKPATLSHELGRMGALAKKLK